MKTIHKKRLQKLIAFLRTLPRKRFNFNIVRNEPPKCGAVGCAIGYCPNVFPRQVQSVPLTAREREWATFTHQVELIGQKDSGFEYVGAWLTGLSIYKASDLFHPGFQTLVDGRLPNLPKTATPKQVARMLEKFIKLAEAGELQPA